MIRNRFIRKATLAISLAALPLGGVAISTSSCATAPKHFSTEAVIAYHGIDVVNALSGLQTSAAEARRQNIITDSELKAVLDAVDQAIPQGKALAAALKASSQKPDELAKFRAVIEALINSALEQIRPEAREQLKLWSDLVFSVLDFIPNK